MRLGPVHCGVRLPCPNEQLATKAVGGAIYGAAVVPGATGRAAVGGILKLPSGVTVSIVTALADNLVTGNKHDPTPDALAAARTATPGDVEVSAAGWWTEFWGKSGISIPAEPEVEKFWYGAQYIMATMSASARLLDKYQGLIPPSGLYGPWVTSDSPAWNGDYTLDYNQEAQYYGAYNSNREEQAEAYFSAILDWMPAARASAQKHALAANYSCPAHALHYACHLAPWGYQSRDQSTYM